MSTDDANESPNIIIVPHETPRTEYVIKDVHIHRAPTDESVKLLREMEQKARDQVEQSINVGGNDFECVINVQHEAMSMDTVAVAIFKLNGKPHRATARVEGWKQKDVSMLVTRIRDAVAEKIATEMVGPAFATAFKFKPIFER